MKTIGNEYGNIRNGELALTIERLEQRIKRVSALLTRSEDESLQSFIKKGQRYYTVRRRDNNNKPYTKYICKSDDETLMKLAQRDYCAKLLPLLKNMCSKLEKLNCNIEEQALSMLPAWEAELLRKGTVNRQEYIEKWLAEPYDINPYKAEERIIETLRGDLVRSKSEREIGNQLYMSDIPYKPDAKISTPGGDLYVDFLTLHPVTLKEMLWEHCGMMDRQEYIKSNYDRIARYAAAGYYPGENLIITVETPNHIVSSRTIQNLIDAYYK